MEPSEMGLLDVQGKPKFFIVQACRGDYLDPGVRGEDEELELPTISATKIRKRRPIGSDTGRGWPDMPPHKLTKFSFAFLLPASLLTGIPCLAH